MMDISKFLGYRVIIDQPGQCCNRFWSYLDTIGWAIANRKKVIILRWDPSLDEFDRLRKSQYVSFPFYHKRLIKKFGYAKMKSFVDYMIWRPGIRFLFLSKFAQRHLGAVRGWPTRVSYNYPQVKEEVVKIFRPNENLCVPIEQLFEDYRNQGYFIIGVHIRRGDYKTFLDGKYYYEFQDYKRHMLQLVSLYSDKKVAFYISTNEKDYDKTIFKDLTLCEFRDASVAQDLYALSLCDRIIGPPSTFSRWASFYGDVALCFIEKDKYIQK